MSRASRRDNSNTASLFPFLAVLLLCTMGVLVVLLSVMASVQVSRAKEKHLSEKAAARQAREARETPEQIRLRARMAELNDRAKQVAEVRVQAEQRLEDERNRLAQIEENIRRREEKLHLLRTEIEELHALDEGSTDDLEQAQEELERQQDLVAQTKQEIEELKKKAREGDKHYAIVPYNGASGTQRQPIYIECRRDKVVFQPEGIELTAADFNTALRSGMPLPAAIRAAQLYYRDHGLIDEKVPYPLVIARPDAGNTYSTVLGLLDSLQAEYGYELVDQNCKLDFSAADPALSDEIRRAVMNARDRLARLRDTAPETYTQYQLESFEPKPSYFDAIERGMLSGRSVIGGSYKQGRSENVRLSSNSIDASRLAAAFESAGGASGNPHHGTQEQALLGAEPTGYDYQKISGGGSGGGMNDRASSPTGKLGAPLDQYAELPMVEGTSTEAAGVTAGQPGSGNLKEGPQESLTAKSMAGQQTAKQTAATGVDSSAGEATAMADATSAGSSSSAASPGGATGNSAPPPTLQASSGPQTSSGSAGGPARKSTTPGLAVSRMIRVQVTADRVIVKSSKLTPGAMDRSIPLDTNPNEAAKRFLQAIRSEIDDWGIAGQGSYWKPVLEMTVSPEGQALAERIAQALRQSGVEVRLAVMTQPSSSLK